MVDEISRAEERRGWRRVFAFGLVAIVVLGVIILFGPSLFNGDERSGMDQLADKSNVGEATKGAVATAVIETETSGEFGTYLTDDAGHPLYLFKADIRGADGGKAESKCYDDCAQAWPPLLTTDQPQARGEAMARCFRRLRGPTAPNMSLITAGRFTAMPRTWDPIGSPGKTSRISAPSGIS